MKIKIVSSKDLKSFNKDSRKVHIFGKFFTKNKKIKENKLIVKKDKQIVKKISYKIKDITIEPKKAKFKKQKNINFNLKYSKILSNIFNDYNFDNINYSNYNVNNIFIDDDSYLNYILNYNED